MSASQKIAIFFLLISFLTESASMESIKGGGTYLQASNACVRAGNWLPTAESMSDNTRFISIMEVNGWDTAWLPIQKTVSESGRHKWLDGVIFEETLSGPDYKGPPKECGILETVYGKKDDAICHEIHGFICQCDHCLTCDSLSPYECVKLDGTCYRVFDTVSSWFAAKNICENINGQLAVIHGEEDRKKISKLIHKHHKDNQDKFFIGFRRVEFYYDANKGRREVQQYHWYKGEPSNAGDCTVLKRFEEGYYWASANCDEKHPYICVENEGITMDSTTTSESQTYSYTLPFLKTTLSSAKKRALKEDISELLQKTGYIYEMWVMNWLLLLMMLLGLSLALGIVFNGVWSIYGRNKARSNKESGEDIFQYFVEKLKALLKYAEELQVKFGKKKETKLLGSRRSSDEEGEGDVSLMQIEHPISSASKSRLEGLTV